MSNVWNKTFLAGKQKMNLDGNKKFPDDPDMRIFATRLAELLAEVKRREDLDESDVAREIGVTPRLLNQWKKRGTITKDERQFWLLCRRLNTHPNYMTGWSQSRYPDEEPAQAEVLDERLLMLKRQLGKGKRSA